MTLIDKTLQFNSVEPVLFVIPAVGTDASCVIVMLLVLVHSFAPVTVTVYIPAELKLLFAVLVVEPPLQA